MRRKVGVVRLGSVRSVYCATLTSRITRTKPSTGPGEAPKSNPSHPVARPFSIMRLALVDLEHVLDSMSRVGVVTVALRISRRM